MQWPSSSKGRAPSCSRKPFAPILALHPWQVERIQVGVAAAQAEDFASEAEVQQTLTSWSSRAAACSCTR